MPWYFLVFLITINGALIQPSTQISWAEEKTTALHTFSLPPDSMSFQPGPGHEIANTYCLICHSADYIYTQPLHSQEKWQSLVLKMKTVFGCPIPDDQILPLSAYLFGQNSVGSIIQERHP